MEMRLALLAENNYGICLIFTKRDCTCSIPGTLYLSKRNKFLTI